MQINEPKNKHQNFISVGFNKLNQEDSKLLEKLLAFCKDKDINRSQFVKSAIAEKMDKGTR